MFNRFVCALLLMGCGIKQEAMTVPAKKSAVHYNPMAVAGVSDPALKQVLHDHWESLMRTYPVWASQLGDHRFDDQLSGVSPEQIERRRVALGGLLTRAQSIKPETLSAADALTHQLFVHALENNIAESVCSFWQWSISPRSNAYVQFAGLGEKHVVKTPQDGQNLLARYRAVPAHIRQQIDNLTRGLEAGTVANQASILLVVQMLDDALAAPMDASPFLSPILKEQTTWQPEQYASWRTDMRGVVEQDILPAFTEYRDFLRDTLAPNARGESRQGLSSLKNGTACYAALVQRYTTLTVDADTLHQRGLDALQGIHDEFRALGPNTVDTGVLSDIFVRLRTTPELYFEQEEQVVAKAETSLERARLEMKNWFGRVPQTECVVTPIPDHEAPYTTIAYYSPPHADGTKPGEYYINTYAPTTRPRHEAEVLAFHEAIPGHHLQIAIAQELPELPAFRKYMGQTAFVEGWALYTERLSEEMGLYTADTDRLGMLSFDAWRAARLVVDTGIHHKGWSREEAETFMKENTPLAENNIRNEVDRYITTPGQALAYKTGQIEMWRLRRMAEERLGEAFDIKQFHDVVLGAGAIPLPILEKRVHAWVTQSK